MDKNFIFNIHNQSETEKWARDFASKLNASSIVTFSGNLGSGKTFIIREIIRYFCGNDINVTSPTFNILQTYQAPDFTIYHFDLYRLKSINEVYELGIEEAFNNNLCLIEWADIIQDILPQHINVSIEIINNQQRLIYLKNNLS